MPQNPIDYVRRVLKALTRLLGLNWGIRSRVILMVLIPAAAIAFALLFFFINAQIKDLERSLEQRAEGLIKQLAMASSHYKLTPNNPKLKDLARNVLIEPDVLSITIQDARGKIVIFAGNPEDSRTQRAKRKKFEVPVIVDSLRTGGKITGEFTYHNLIDTKRNVIIEGFVITLIGLLVSTLLALRLGRSVTHPIMRLTETVRDISQGKLDSRIYERSKGEIGKLEQGINSMGTVLQETHDYLQRKIDSATAQLRNALTETELQNEELDKARKQALEMSSIKSEFLANMSHEIRTPLNGIMGFTNLLLKTELGDAQRDQVNTIKQSTATLLTVINDTLDFSRIEAGQLHIEAIAFNLREILEDAVALLAPNAYDKGLDLILIPYSDVPSRLISDPVRIRQIVTNLVSNAIKFTQKGSITIRVMLEEDSAKEVTLKVSVQDTGLGMSPKEQTQIFNPYVPLQEAGQGKYSGIHLGLVICKKLVENMRGHMGVESKIGQGSTFWFTFKAPVDKSKKELLAKTNPFRHFHCVLYDQHELSRLAIVHQISDWGMEIEEVDTLDRVAQRLRQSAASPNTRQFAIVALNKEELEAQVFRKFIKSLPHPNTAPLVVLASSVNKAVASELLEQGADLVLPKTVRVAQLYDKFCSMLLPSSTQKPGANAPQELNLTGINVLVADDNQINRKLIQALLEEKGVHILEAKNGKQAVDLFATQHLDLILMDIQMPLMSGLDATKKIRAMEHGQQRTPIVALTANILDGDQERFIRAGFDDFLLKPIQDSNLYDLVVRWVSVEAQRPKAAANSHKTVAEPLKVPSRPTEPVSKMFDRKLALRLTGGNMELANELFQMLVNDLPNMKRVLNQATNPLDSKRLENAAHKIQGAASYCAVNAIKESAALLEKAAHLGVEREILLHVAQLNRDIDALLKEQQELKQRAATTH